MDIYPLGHSSFKIKGKAVAVVTDPYDSAAVGLKFPKTEGVNIVTISHNHSDHAYVQALGLTQSCGRDNGVFIINGPGEYEVAGVSITGISSFHDEKGGSERGGNTIYRIEIDGLSLCHLGDLGHKLTEEQKDKIGGVDILFIPCGGTYTINAAAASEVAAQLEPRIIIPMHYQRAGLNTQNFKELEPVEKFLKEMGTENITPQAKLSTSAEKLPESTTVVILE